MKEQPKDERLRYDAVVKDVFQHDHPVLLDQMTDGVAVRESLNVEFAMVVERRADLVLLLEDETIFHLDFQSENDDAMAYRMGNYGLMIGQKYRRRVRQTVLYIGEPALRMADSVDVGEFTVKYRLMDIREFDVDTFLKSGRPGDCALAVLARGGEQNLAKILKAAYGLPKGKRQKVLSQIAILSGLRRLSGKLTMELQRMGNYIDIEENEILREIRDTAKAQGRAEGRAEGMTEAMAAVLSQLLETKFGPLPRWARTRLRKAPLAEVERWIKQVLPSDTLEGVLGKR